MTSPVVPEESSKINPLPSVSKNTQVNEKKTVNIKISMLGDSAIGKTTLMNKYVEGKLQEDYIETLGVNFMEKKLRIKFNCIVILQPTSPFRKVEDIDLTLEKLINLKADSAVTVVEIEDNHPVKIKKMDGDRLLPYCMSEPEKIRRQDLPKAYKRSGAVYAMKREILMNEGMIFGEYVVGHIVPRERSIDIDTPLQWIQAKYMLKKIQE